MTHGHLSLHVLFRDIFIPATFVFPQHTYIHPLLHICCCYIFVIGILRNTSSLWFRYIFVPAAIVFPRHIPTLSTTYIQPLAFALLALALQFAMALNAACRHSELGSGRCHHFEGREQRRREREGKGEGKGVWRIEREEREQRRREREGKGEGRMEREERRSGGECGRGRKGGERENRGGREHL